MLATGLLQFVVCAPVTNIYFKPLEQEDTKSVSLMNGLNSKKFAKCDHLMA